MLEAFFFVDKGNCIVITLFRSVRPTSQSHRTKSDKNILQKTCYCFTSDENVNAKENILTLVLATGVLRSILKRLG